MKQCYYQSLKPEQKRILVWFYFGKRKIDDEAIDEEVESDLHSGGSLLDEENGEKIRQTAIDETNKRKEGNIFLIKALKLFACASTLWSSLIFYGLLQVGFEEKPGANKSVHYKN